MRFDLGMANDECLRRLHRLIQAFARAVSRQIAVPRVLGVSAHRECQQRHI